MNTIVNIVLVLAIALNWLSPVLYAPINQNRPNAPLMQEDVPPTPTADVPTLLPPEPTETPTLLPTEVTETPTEFPLPEETILPEETPSPTPEDQTPVVEETSIPVVEQPAPIPTEVRKPTIEIGDLEIVLNSRFFANNRKNELKWKIRNEKELDPGVYELVITLPEGVESTLPAENQSIKLTLEKHGKVDLSSNLENLFGQQNILFSLLKDGEVVGSQEITFEFAEAADVSNKEQKQISAMGGKIKLSVPEGTFGEDATVWVKPASPKMGFAEQPLGVPFELFADGKNSNKDLHQFSNSIKIAYEYGEQEFGGLENELKLSFYDETTGLWLPLPSWVDNEANIVYGMTDHFSAIAVEAKNFQSSRLPALSSTVPSLSTGAATYRLPVVLPPGPGGFNPPSIDLSYNSQVVDGMGIEQQSGMTGVGWSFDTGRITRNMMGTEDYEGDDTFSMTVGDFSTPLILSTDGYYHTIPETHWRITKYVYNGNPVWAAWDKNNTLYMFGEGNARALSPMIDYEECDDGDWNMGASVYEWALTSITNIYGKKYEFTYYRDEKIFDPKCNGANGSQRTVHTALYPLTILYPNGQYGVKFNYEERNDYLLGWYSYYGYRRAFYRYRLNSIQIIHKKTAATSIYFADSSTYVPIRTYALGYANGSNQILPEIFWNNNPAHKTSTLVQWTETSSNANGQSITFPSTTLTYGDQLHLTKVDNGYGGSVEFIYKELPFRAESAGDAQAMYGMTPGSWVYTSDPHSYNWHISSGEARVSAYHMAINNGDDPIGEVYKLLPTSLIYPNGTYLIMGDIQVDSGHAQMGLGYETKAGEKAILWSDSVSTNTQFWFFKQLPKNASLAKVVVQCNSCKVKIDNVMVLWVRHVLTRYRVERVDVKNGSNPAFAKTRTTNYIYGPGITNGNTPPGGTCPALTTTRGPGQQCLKEVFSEFRGHEWVKETGPDGLVTTTYFHTDDILQGKVSRVLVEQGGYKISDTYSYYSSEIIPTSTATLPHREGQPAYQDFKGYFVYQTSQENWKYDSGGNLQKTRTEYFYEVDKQGGKQYGNVTKVKESWWAMVQDTFPGNSTGQWIQRWIDKRVTVTEYFPLDNPNSYLVGLPGRTYSYACLAVDCQAYDFKDGTTLSQTLYIYDSAEPTTWNTPPSLGILKGMRSLICRMDAAGNCLPMGTSGTGQAKWRDERYSYDAWGNRIVVDTWTGFGTTSTLASEGIQRTLYCYGTLYASTGCTDDGHYTYLRWAKNPKGHQTTIDYDMHLGVPVSETDPNGMTVTATYDAAGRIRKVIRPGSTEQFPSVEVVYYDTFPYWTEVKERLDDVNTVAYRKFYDGIGTLVQTQVIGAEVDGSTKDIITNYFPYWVDQGIYRVYTQSIAYAVPTGSTGYRIPDTSQPKTVDAVNQLGTTIHYNTDGTATKTTIAFSGLNFVEISNIDVDGQVTKTYKDLWDRVMLVVPPTGPSIRFSYGVNGIDTPYLHAAMYGSAKTQITYMPSGAKMSMSDPDMGNWSYSYDALGNLVSQTDARGCITAIKYDLLNRPTEKSFSGPGACATTPKILTWYDGDDRTTVTNAKGRLTYQRAEGVVNSQWFYNDLGQVTKDLRTVVGIGTFNTLYEYYHNGSVKSMTYPLDNTGVTGEKVDYTYTPQGSLDTMKGFSTYVYDSKYDAQGRITHRSNNMYATLQTNYTYYPWTAQEGLGNSNGRLKQVNLFYSGATPTITYLSNSYTYFKDGNIQTISRRNGEVESFTYDALDRLISARADEGSSPYNPQTFTYDTEGRLVNNPVNSGDFTYATDPLSRPFHAVRGINGTTESYTYDANGNQTGRTMDGSTTTLTYDAENHLTKAVNTVKGIDITYRYDGSGAMISKKIGTTTTVYIGGYFEWSGSTATSKKYYSAGGQTVAMREGSLSGATGLTWLASDHLNSTSVMINVSDYSQYSELRYSPWGETRDTIGVPTTDRKYTGQREEAALGLYYYNARWYDPALSHFIMADTIIPGADNPLAWDRYAYVNNNPVRYTDPTGHCPICVFAVFVAAAIILPWITSDTADPQELETKTTEQTLSEMGQAADLSMQIIGLGLGVTELYYVGGQTLGNVKPRLALSSDDGELPNVAGNPANFAKPSKNNSLPNDALVCRAGTCEAERFGTPGADGKLIDVSTSSYPGKTVGELSQPFPNNQVGVTTVGAVRAAGGDVIMSASRDNRYHATLFGITPEQAAMLFRPTMWNPNKPTSIQK